ncbi:MAG: hypothetical protein AAF738_07770 [Bacteroidota bacterium]
MNKTLRRYLQVEYTLIKTVLMQENFTTQDLIRFIYQETTAAEKIAISEALATDPALEKEYEDLLAGVRKMPKVTFSPAKNILDNILQHSKHTALV